LAWLARGGRLELADNAPLPPGRAFSPVLARHRVAGRAVGGVDSAVRGLGLEIGKPRRTITVEPVEDPVPRKRPEPVPEERPVPKRRQREKVPG
jgi:hypothetical protein